MSSNNIDQNNSTISKSSINIQDNNNLKNKNISSYNKLYAFGYFLLGILFTLFLFFILYILSLIFTSIRNLYVNLFCMI